MTELAATNLQCQLLPCILEIRELAAVLDEKGEKTSFPAKLDELFARRTRAVPPGEHPFHVFVSANPDDWLPPYGPKTNMYVAVHNVKDAPDPFLFSANGIVMARSDEMKAVPNATHSGVWRSYMCYWPVEPDNYGRPDVFWEIPPESRLWYGDAAKRFAPEKSLSPESERWWHGTGPWPPPSIPDTRF